MKAWYVTLNDCDSAYVLAETRGKATMAAIREWEGWGGDWAVDGSWHDLRCRRAPDLDGERLTEAQLVIAGRMRTECHVCGTWLPQRDDWIAGPVSPLWIDRDRCFCSAACLDRMRTIDPRPESPQTVWLLSTEY